MSNFVLGDTVTQLWTVLDANNDPVTGVTTPAGVVFTLHRQSGATMIAASETVSWTEIGVTGHYYISFTPLNIGLYVLQLEELHASSLLRTFRFPDVDVMSAGSVFSPTYSNAFCAETDIERRLNQTISATTSPSDTAAAAFAETRAAILMSICAKLGYTVTPTTITAGSRLEDLLRDANAIGAALDYTLAQQLGPSPSKSERVNDFQELWEQYTRGLGYLAMEIRGNLASLSTNHIISGDTLANPTETAGTVYSQPIGIGMGDTF